MATMVLDDPAGYGRVVRDDDGHVERVVETKPPATRRRSSSRSARSTARSSPSTAPPCSPRSAREPRQRAGRAVPARRPAGAARGRPHWSARTRSATRSLALGVNDRVQLAEVRTIAQQRIHDAHRRAGVDDRRRRLDAHRRRGRIGEDTVIEPSSFLRGATTIGRGCTVGPLTTLIDATLHDEVTIPHSYVVGAEIESNATVGPFAYLRPGTVLRERSKAGTFVEIKNSDIGRGSKVPHLSYIGDADIGEDTNLGAATITANYDGVDKHRTTIGDRVHTGVDTTLVAPVTLGDDAFTARELGDHEERPARRARRRPRAPDEHRGLRRA